MIGTVNSSLPKLRGCVRQWPILQQSGRGADVATIRLAYACPW